ncbi:MAG: hypothetical protein ABSF41_04915 [Pseudolabrys sp.]|jgi:hypothetical protein
MRSKLGILLDIPLRLGIAQAGFGRRHATKAPIVKAPVAVPYNWTGFYIGVNGGSARAI